MNNQPDVESAKDRPSYLSSTVGLGREYEERLQNVERKVRMMGEHYQPGGTQTISQFLKKPRLQKKHK